MKLHLIHIMLTIICFGKLSFRVLLNAFVSQTWPNVERMIPKYHSWRKVVASWPRDLLDSYLALLFQLHLHSEYDANIIHAAARFLGPTTELSQEYLECWVQVGVVQILANGAIQLNAKHEVFQRCTPPTKPIPVSCLIGCSHTFFVVGRFESVCFHCAFRLWTAQT